MELIFKTHGAEIKVTARTNRIKCTACNGQGESFSLDEDNHQCPSCAGTGEFIIQVQQGVEGIERYFSKNDLEKMELIRKLHEYQFGYQVYRHGLGSYQQQSRSPYPEEKDLLVWRTK